MIVSALAIDPERLLWVPGRKTIFIPPSAEISEFSEYITVATFSDEIAFNLGYRAGLVVDTITRMEFDLWIPS